MFLHDINYSKFDIYWGNTLTNPSPNHINRKFEAIVSNPPYSVSWDGNDDITLTDDQRFSVAGALAPISKADLAFTMHMLHCLATDGTAAIVEFPGVLYRSGAEQKIRKYLIGENYIDAVIQLPANLFYGVSIATCIIVLKKSKKNEHSVLFIDASKESVHIGNKEVLSQENIDKILNAYKERKDIEHFAKIVRNEEILENDSNLSVSSYIEPIDDSEDINIAQLNSEIEEMVDNQNELRKAIDDIINNDLIFEEEKINKKNKSRKNK